MLLAYDYPLLGIFFSTIFFFLWVLWLMMLFHVIVDIFRNHDIGGFGKAAWLALTVFLPFIGVFAYVIAHGDDMGEHARDDRRAQYEAGKLEFEGSSSGAGNVADQIAQLGRLHDEGVLSDADYEAARARVLA